MRPTSTSSSRWLRRCSTRSASRRQGSIRSRGTFEVEANEYVYARRGLTLYVNRAVDTTLRIAAFAPSSLERYQRDLRLDLQMKRLPPSRGPSGIAAMTGLTSSPKLIKGGLVVLAPGGGTVRRQIALQYNPDTLTRSYQVQGAGGDGGGERAQPFRLKGPGDRDDQARRRDRRDRPARAIPTRTPTRSPFGIAPQLAALEALVNPSVDDLLAIEARPLAGTLEILPPEAPLTLFVWSKSRVVPVRVTEFSITEEAFDPALNPIRAKVSSGLRVMSTDDLGFSHRGGTHLPQLPAQPRDACRPDRARLAGLARSFQPAADGAHDVPIPSRC